MEDTRRAPRRRHSEELKARVLAACAQPGTSVAKVALTHGLNANLVHKWRRADQGASAGVVASGHAMHGGDEFIALRLPQHSAPASPGPAKHRLCGGDRAPTAVRQHFLDPRILPTMGGRSSGHGVPMRLTSAAADA